MAFLMSFVTLVHNNSLLVLDLLFEQRFILIVLHFGSFLPCYYILLLSLDHRIRSYFSECEI